MFPPVVVDTPNTWGFCVLGCHLSSVSESPKWTGVDSTSSLCCPHIQLPGSFQDFEAV